MRQLSLTQLASFVFCLAGHAQVVLPGIANSKLDAALKGRVLIEELNCVACHEAKPLAASSRKSPRLAEVGRRVHPEFLRAFIENPHHVKPGTLMPDVLEGKTAAKKKEVAEAITHFLVSLNKGEEFKLRTPDAVAAEFGEKLFHSVGCVACHSPRDASGKELLRQSSVPLGELEKKYSHKSLSEFLRRPHATRPSGRMPDMRLPGHEVDRITHYLLRKTNVPGHLAYTTWRGNVWEGLEGNVRKEKGGLVDDFSLEQLGKVHHHTAIQYAGFLQIEITGDYSFYLEMNGGSLHLNGSEVVSEAPSDRRGPKKLEGSAKLNAGWNRIEHTYFHTGRGPRFVFEMEGPGFKRQPIPSSMLSISDKPIPEFRPLKVDPELAAKGQEHFEKFRCAQCHTDVRVRRQKFTPMSELNPDKGCLAEAAGVPRFNLSGEQRKLIKLALPGTDSASFTDQQMVDRTLVALNCIACHERKGLGGISPDRDKWFTGTHEALGNQGRIPPPLTHVGAKLNKSWLSEVMLHGGRQRMYLHTRMPLFGHVNVAHLVDRFAKTDSLEEVTFPKASNIRESKNAGYEMMGTTGFSCIACHDFNGQKSTAGALELVNITERIQKKWFHLYMLQPSRFHPTVIMPTYWPGGESIRKELLGGDTSQQIEALWSYLSDGPRAKSPKGLSRQSRHLRVADETMMCRGRGTAGFRGIGVGYPERISLAFDSEEMALRLLWRGTFANIGFGSFHARGRDRISFPPGIPFHQLKSMDAPWPYKGKTNYLFPHDHGYQFRGYYLDKQKRPTFMYRYGQIAIEDLFEDLLDGEGKAFFRRTMSFVSLEKQEMFFFRVASGKEIKEEGKEWRIDRLKLRMDGELKPQVRDGDPRELLIPMLLPKGKTVLTLEYQW